MPILPNEDGLFVFSITLNANQIIAITDIISNITGFFFSFYAQLILNRNTS